MRRRAYERLSAQVAEEPLDRAKPPWEIWVVEGLEDRRFALIVRAHHCTSDGASAMALMQELFRSEPSRCVPEASRGWELLAVVRDVR